MRVSVQGAGWADLGRPAPAVPVFGSRRLVAVAALLAIALLFTLHPALARSSLGIGTAEVTAQPSGPFAELFIWINGQQRAFFTSLRGALVAMKNGTGGTLFLVALSFAYGVFHAAGPGHGKAVISSYVLANEVQLRRGILLSFVSALFQALTALLVIGAGFLLLRGTMVSMTDATNGLEIASYALIVVFGLWLLVSKLMRLVRRARPAGGLDFAPVAASGVGGLAFTAPMSASSSASLTSARATGAFRTGGVSAGRAFPDAGLSAGRRVEGLIMRPASGAMTAEVCTDADEDCDCGRPHMVDPKALGTVRLSLGTAAAAVFAVGLRPCSGAIVVLSFALLNGLVLGGVLSVLAMAMGTAITVSAIAALAVFAKGAALRFGAAGGVRRRVLDGVEICGALLVVALGGLLLGGALA
ncbi:MAG: nickel/cobalt transporter [Rhizobiaceae bacterium]|nr:nickel/cobalt transporter [Rhizobiaceae bacterium]